jgi:hypothetical protein
MIVLVGTSQSAIAGDFTPRPKPRCLSVRLVLKRKGSDADEKKKKPY